MNTVNTNAPAAAQRFYRTGIYPYITVETLHPADLNADRVITLGEVTVYAGAYNGTRDWPVAPYPVPYSYLQHASQIYASGGGYYTDPSLPPPFCWVPGP